MFRPAPLRDGRLIAADEIQRRALVVLLLYSIFQFQRCSGPSKPKLIIAEVLGAIAGMVNLGYDLFVIYYSLGVLGSILKSTVAYYL